MLYNYISNFDQIDVSTVTTMYSNVNLVMLNNTIHL